MLRSLYEPILRLSGLLPDSNQASVRIDALQPSIIHDENQLRINLYNVIKNGVLKLEPCQLSQNFVQWTHLSDNRSASYAWISLAQLKVPADLMRTVAHDVALKIAYEPLPQNTDRSLQVEREVYERVTNHLLMNGNTPHVTFYYGTLACDTFVQQLKQNAATNEDAKRLLHNMHKHYRWRSMPKNYNLDHMRAMVLEKNAGRTLEAFLRQDVSGDKLADFEVLLPIFFQIIYTLAAFRDVGLQHNDLHTQNVFVGKKETAARSVYQVTKDSAYALDTIYDVRIFDFDRAYKASTATSSFEINNVHLREELCTTFGVCEKQDSRLELFRLFHFCNKHSSSNKALREFLEFCVPADLLDLVGDDEPYDLPAVGSACLCNAANGCDTCDIINDVRIKLPREILASHYFERYRLPQTSSLPLESAAAVTPGSENIVWRLPTLAVDEN